MKPLNVRQKILTSEPLKDTKMIQRSSNIGRSSKLKATVPVPETKATTGQCLSSGLTSEQKSGIRTHVKGKQRTVTPCHTQ